MPKKSQAHNSTSILLRVARILKPKHSFCMDAKIHRHTSRKVSKAQKVAGLATLTN